MEGNEVENSACLNAKCEVTCRKKYGCRSMMMEALPIVGVTVALTFEAIALESRLLLQSHGLSEYAVTLNKALLIFNRFGIALAMPAIGMLLDTGLSPNNMASLLGLGFVMAGLTVFVSLSTGLSRRIARFTFSMVFQKVLAQNELTATGRFSLDTGSFSVGILISIGLAFPAILAAVYPDYRASLLQTGFLLNSFTLIYNIFAVDRPNSTALAGADAAPIIYRSIKSKTLGYLVTGAGLALVPTLIA